MAYCRHVTHDSQRETGDIHLPVSVRKLRQLEAHIVESDCSHVT